MTKRDQESKALQKVSILILFFPFCIFLSLSSSMVLLINYTCIYLIS